MCTSLSHVETICVQAMLARRYRTRNYMYMYVFWFLSTTDDQARNGGRVISCANNPPGVDEDWGKSHYIDDRTAHSNCNPSFIPA